MVLRIGKKKATDSSEKSFHSTLHPCIPSGWSRWFWGEHFLSFCAGRFQQVTCFRSHLRKGRLRLLEPVQMTAQKIAINTRTKEAENLRLAGAQFMYSPVTQQEETKKKVCDGRNESVCPRCSQSFIATVTQSSRHHNTWIVKNTHGCGIRSRPAISLIGAPDSHQYDQPTLASYTRPSASYGAGLGFNMLQQNRNEPGPKTTVK